MLTCPNATPSRAGLCPSDFPAEGMAGRAQTQSCLGGLQCPCYCRCGTWGSAGEDRDRRAQVARLRHRHVRPQPRAPSRTHRQREHVLPLLPPVRRAHAAGSLGELRPGRGRLGSLPAARAHLDPLEAAAARGRPAALAALRSAPAVHDAVRGDDPRLHPPALPAVPAEPHGLPLREVRHGVGGRTQRARLHGLAGLAATTSCASTPRPTPRRCAWCRTRSTPSCSRTPARRRRSGSASATRSTAGS